MKGNIKEESGIQNFWEDEQLDIKMKNLNVIESGLLSKYKVKEFQSDYEIFTENVIKVPGTRHVSEEEII